MHCKMNHIEAKVCDYEMKWYLLQQFNLPCPSSSSVSRSVPFIPSQSISLNGALINGATISMLKAVSIIKSRLALPDINVGLSRRWRCIFDGR